MKKGSFFDVPNKKILGISGTAWMFDAMDIGLLSFIMVALAEDWGLSMEQVGMLPSINSLGMAIGALVFGILADRVGRKKVFMWSLLLFSVCLGLSAFTTTLAAFAILRLFIGMGLGGELPVASTLVSESTPVEHRGKVVVLLESFWAIGWIISAVIAYFIIPTYGWEVALLISALPAFFVLVIRRQIPESEKFEKADRVSLKDRVKKVWSKDYSRNTLMLWILWFCVIFSYYGMFMWLPSVMTSKGFTMIDSFQYVLIMALAQLPGYFSAAYLVERVGRKFVLISFLIGTAISGLVFGLAESATTLLIAGMCLNFFNLGAWGAMYAYTPENYPTDVRGTGAGLAASFGRIGGILGPALVPIMAGRGFETGQIFAVFAVAIFIGVLAVAILGKETKNTIVD